MKLGYMQVASLYKERRCQPSRKLEAAGSARLKCKLYTFAVMKLVHIQTQRLDTFHFEQP